MENQTPEHHIHHTLENMKIIAAKDPAATASNEMIHDFAFLLSKLVEQADRSTRRMASIARITLFVAIVAALLTLAQLGFAFVQVACRMN